MSYWRLHRRTSRGKLFHCCRKVVPPYRWTYPGSQVAKFVMLKCVFFYNRLLLLKTLYPIYTIQPVECSYTQYSRLSIRLSNGFDNRFFDIRFFDIRFDNRVEQTDCSFNTVVKHGCQTGCTNRFNNRFDNRIERTASVRSTVCQTGLYNRLNVCIHDTTGCKTGLTTGCIV